MKTTIEFVFLGLMILGLSIPTALIFLFIFWLLRKACSIWLASFICLLVASAISMAIGSFGIAIYAVLHPDKTMSKLMSIWTENDVKVKTNLGESKNEQSN